MSTQVNFLLNEEKKHTFGEIANGDFFCVEGKLYLKIEEFFITKELIHEVEFVQSIEYEEDIESKRYNCWVVGSQCDYRYFDDTIEVEEVDVEISARLKK